jgi:hypothetical protein
VRSPRKIGTRQHACFHHRSPRSVSHQYAETPPAVVLAGSIFFGSLATALHRCRALRRSSETSHVWVSRPRMIGVSIVGGLVCLGLEWSAAPSKPWPRHSARPTNAVRWFHAVTHPPASDSSRRYHRKTLLLRIQSKVVPAEDHGIAVLKTVRFNEPGVKTPIQNQSLFCTRIFVRLCH